MANISPTLEDHEIAELAACKVVAVRFNLKRGGTEQLKSMEYLSNRLFEEFGWHTELYVDSRELQPLKTTLQGLPKFSIDHLGLSKSGLQDLFFWVGQGAKVKATGFGRVDFNPMEVMRNIYEINPESLMFGTDLPSTRSAKPFSLDDIRLIQDHFDLDEQERIFFKNAWNWYRGDSSTSDEHA